MSKTVMLRSGPGVMESISGAIRESGIPEGERVLLCSPRLYSWICGRCAELGAQPIAVGYLEDRKIIVTDLETARKIAPASVQAGRA